MFLLSRLWNAWRRVLLVAAAAFVGMVLESLFILNYQVKSGVLFQDIGVLLMLFMAGLALGGLFVDRVASRGMMRGNARGLAHGRLRIGRPFGAGLIAGFILLSASTTALLRADALRGFAASAVLLCSSGFLVAGVLAYASLHRIGEQVRVVSPLYAADLIGGCLGSLLASLVLMPLFGLDVAAAWMLYVAVAMLFLI
jgi:hypothetical protein